MKKTLTTLLRASLVMVTLMAFSGCGLKGPLVLEQRPVDQTQAPLENSIDQIPLETPAEINAAQSNSESSTETGSETTTQEAAESE